MRVILAPVFAVAHKSLLKKRADPFDCYDEETKGADYKGLHKQTKSGRVCIAWPEDSASFTFCRNPAGAEDQPFCYFAEGETEACAVPKCDPKAEDPEGWVAPVGSVTYKKPCPAPAEKKPVYKAWHEGKACRATEEIAEGQEVTTGTTDSGVGMTAKVADKRKRGAIWLAKLTHVDDADACMDECHSTPGAKYMTFWAGEKGCPSSQYGETKDGSAGNCGCFYECVEMKDDLTTGDPTTYRRLY
mmetsp:Transcript_12018/g.26613  ORF Transcript_12018/g.26613 Transcript_12018/m.26613 type:complete len:245 (-) Transcript_12018:81-815(-)